MPWRRSPHEHEEIADRFFAAIERNDIGALDALYHDDIAIWHSYDNAYQGRAENLAVLASIHRLGTPRYRVIERVCVGERIVQRTTSSSSRTIRGRISGSRGDFPDGEGQADRDAGRIPGFARRDGGDRGDRTGRHGWGLGCSDMLNLVP